MVSWFDKIILLKELIRGKLARTHPRYVTLSLTNTCNLGCLNCRFHGPLKKKGDHEPAHLSFEFVTELAHELQTIGVYEIILSGAGEPLLHPQIRDIIALLKDVGFFVTLITNGTLLNKGIIAHLIEARLDVVKVSLWAKSQEEYRLNYPGIPLSSFEKTLENMGALAQRKVEHKSPAPRLIWHYPCNRNNMHNLERLIDRARAAGCNALTFSPLKTQRTTFAEQALSQTEQSELRRSLQKAKTLLQHASIDHNIDMTLRRYTVGEAVWNTLPCYVGWIHARIAEDGNVYPCNHPCDLVLGDLHTCRFSEIWRGAAFQAFRQQAMTRDGLKALGSHCDCGFCCHFDMNLRIHRYYRWFVPWRKLCMKFDRPSKRI